MLLGQFTYARGASHGPAATPDWAVTGVLPETAVLDLNLVRAATRPLAGFAATELPLLATNAELDALPRRLRLDRLDEDRVALTQQVCAGYDDDHHPTWLAHGLLVELHPTPMNDVRPGDLWGSPGWLHPTDRNEVQDAQLLPGFGRPAAAGDWTPDPNLMSLVLTVLENAAGIGRIAFVDRSGAETARWVRMVGNFLTPWVAWCLPFSTSEDGSVDTEGLRVVGVSSAGALAARGAQAALGPDWLVLDPMNPPTFQASPAGWRLPDGRWLPMGGWAAFAVQLFADLGADRVRALIDEQTAWLEDTGHPLFALPVAVLLADSSLFSTRSPLRRTAAVLAAASWPTGLTIEPEHRASLSAALTRSHPDPVGVATMLVRSADAGPSPAPNCDDALETYLEAIFTRPIDGRGWTASTESLPWLPELVRPGPELLERWLERLPVRIGWLLGPTDPIAVARGLSTVMELARRWQSLDHPTVLLQFAPRLAEAVALTVTAGTPVVDGRWPLLPPAVATAVAQLMTPYYESPSSRDPVPAALYWMDAQYGAVDLVGAGSSGLGWNALDLARTAGLNIIGRPDRDVATIRAAQAIRRAVRVAGP